MDNEYVDHKIDDLLKQINDLKAENQRLHKLVMWGRNRFSVLSHWPNNRGVPAARGFSDASIRYISREVDNINKKFDNKNS